MFGFLKVGDFYNTIGKTSGFETDFLSKFLRKESLSTYIKPVSFFEKEKVFLLSDDHIGVVFECFPQIGVSRDVFVALSSLYSFNYPKDTEVQFTVWGSDFLEPFVDRFRDLRKGENIWVKKSAEFLLRHTKHPVNNVVRTPFRDFKLFVSMKIPFGEDLTPEEALEKYKEYFEDVEGRLSAMRFYPVRLDAQGLIMYLYMIFNPDHDKRTIKKFPDRFYYGDIIDFLGSYLLPDRQIVDASFLLSLNVIVGSHEKIKEAQNQKNKALFKMRKIATRSLPRLKERVDEAEDVNEIVISGGKKFVKANLVWWIYSKDEKAIKHQEKMLETLVTAYKGGFKIQRESKQSALLQLFNATPLNSDYELDKISLQRYRT